MKKLVTATAAADPALELEDTVIKQAHRVLIERVIKESSLEALFDIISDYIMARSGLASRKPTIDQRRYREMGPALGEIIEIANKRGL